VLQLGDRINPLAGLLSPEDQAARLREQIKIETGCYTVVDFVATMSLEGPGGDSGQGSTKLAFPAKVLDMVGRTRGVPENRDGV